MGGVPQAVPRRAQVGLPNSTLNENFMKIKCKIKLSSGKSYIKYDHNFIQSVFDDNFVVCSVCGLPFNESQYESYHKQPISEKTRHSTKKS